MSRRRPRGRRQHDRQAAADCYFCRLPCAKNPIHSASGEKNGSAGVFGTGDHDGFIAMDGTQE